MLRLCISLIRDELFFLAEEILAFNQDKYQDKEHITCFFFLLPSEIKWLKVRKKHKLKHSQRINKFK